MNAQLPTVQAWDLEPCAEDAALAEEWEQLAATWLAATGSHTRRAYTRALRLWIMWLAQRDVRCWEATWRDAQAWQTHLAAEGASDATVCARLSAVSSFYTFVIRRLHAAEEAARTAFVDGKGRVRSNPFRVGNLARPRIRPYRQANPLGAGDLRRLFSDLAQRATSVTGARNYALLLTYFLTAARNRDILELRWGDIRPRRGQEGWVYVWRGKRGKAMVSPLPARAYHAICRYLEFDGRVEPEPDAYIWLPITRHGAANLASARHATAARPHISPQNTVRILQSALRRAGVADPTRYRIHDLRHSFAHMFSGDLDQLRRILHHGSLATTGTYVAALHDPADDYSDALLRRVGL